MLPTLMAPSEAPSAGPSAAESRRPNVPTNNTIFVMLFILIFIIVQLIQDFCCCSVVGGLSETKLDISFSEKNAGHKIN